MDLASATTKELVEELAKREGVIGHCIAPHVGYILKTGASDKHVYTNTGPARILVVSA